MKRISLTLLLFITCTCNTFFQLKKQPSPLDKETAEEYKKAIELMLATSREHRPTQNKNYLFSVLDKCVDGDIKSCKEAQYLAKNFDYLLHKFLTHNRKYCVYSNFYDIDCRNILNRQSHFRPGYNKAYTKLKQALSGKTSDNTKN